MSFECDADGYLLNFSEWSEEYAREKAALSGLTLTKTHFEILHGLRDFYKEFHATPPTRYLVKLVQESSSNPFTSSDLHFLFPDGIFKQGCLLAGLPRPERCFS